MTLDDKFVTCGILIGYKLGFNVGTLTELNNHVAVNKGDMNWCKEIESKIDFLVHNFEYVIDNPSAKTELDSFIKELGYIEKEKRNVD